MSEIKTGGPAFPQGIDQGASEAGFPIAEITGGLTIRDYFAAKALQGLMANPNVVGFNASCGWSLVNCDHDDISRFALTQAGSVIKALEAKP